jgi:glycerol uptake facilitator-like aquaporin
MDSPMSRRIEAIGTAFLLAAITGSGIMGERLSGGNIGLALLANSIATGAALWALILTFAPLSGAHFNPAVTLAMGAAGEIPRVAILPYILAQCIGAVIGVWAAHLMFALPILQSSAHVRNGVGQWTGEFIATFGLLAVIESGRRHFRAALPAAVSLYIVAAYWFTSSTSFANPAVTLARSLTDSFAGIAPANIAGFIAAQMAGATVAVFIMRWLHGEATTAAGQTASAKYPGDALRKPWP